MCVCVKFDTILDILGGCPSPPKKEDSEKIVL